MKTVDTIVDTIFSVCLAITGFAGAYAVSYIIVDTICNRFGGLSAYFDRNPFAGSALFGMSFFVLLFLALGVCACIYFVKLIKEKQ